MFFNAIAIEQRPSGSTYEGKDNRLLDGDHPNCLETLVGGITDLVHGKEILVAGSPVADIVTHLGYPLYFLRIIGVWKLLGGIVLLIPGYPRLKEWAYAGIFFELSGAAASWWMHEHNMGEAVAPMILAVVALVSWALRPQHRLLGILVPRFNVDA